MKEIQQSKSWSLHEFRVIYFGKDINSLTFYLVSFVIRFDDAGFSLTGTKEVLSSIASDCMVDDGDCLNAVEIFWTPSDRDEVMSRIDMITDFPELIDL